MERERVVLSEVYKECMRNHAAKLGTYAADGCCEYTADEARPGSLSCAACGCHRNFHRKVFLDGHQQQQPAAAQTQAAEGRRRQCPEGSKPRRARTKFTEEQKARMASFAERIGWKIPRRAEGGIGGGEVAAAGDDVTRFCLEIGVSRQVFKVWMHNHRSGGGGGGKGGDGAASSSMSQTAASGGDEEAS